jgi:hypothetical protein
MAVARYLDLVVLVLALPLFAVAGLPMLGYAVTAGAWLVQRGIQHLAERSVARASERRQALGVMAVATLGRVWLVTLAILLVGVLADDEDGLAGAVLALVLFTVYLAGEALTRLLAPREVAR